MTTKKRLQDAMQAAVNRPFDAGDSCAGCGRFFIHAEGCPGETAPGTGPDRRESDETGAGVSRDTPEDHGGAESVVEQAARVLYERYCAENGIAYEWRSYESSWWDVWVEQAQALADAGLLADPEARARVAELEAESWDLVRERDRAIVEQRPLVDALTEARRERDAAEAEVERLRDDLLYAAHQADSFRRLRDEWQGRAERAEGEVAGERAVTERLNAIARVTPCTCSAQRERADRAEAKVERIEALFAGGPDTPCRTTWPDGVECVEVPLADLIRALSGSDAREDGGHDCSTCRDCLHDGHRCCGCYDGACCKAREDGGQP